MSYARQVIEAESPKHVFKRAARSVTRACPRCRAPLDTSHAVLRIYYPRNHDLLNAVVGGHYARPGGWFTADDQLPLHMAAYEVRDTSDVCAACAYPNLLIPV